MHASRARACSSAHQHQARFSVHEALPDAPVTLLHRSSLCCPQVTVDASNVPNEYALAILSECMTFPRRLVFFLKGYLTVRWPSYTRSSADIIQWFQGMLA